MSRPSQKGFVKLRRGIAEHLPGLSAHASKLFLVLLVNAVPTGTKRGIVAASVAELVKLSGIRRQTLLLAADQLEHRGWLMVSKAKNQHATTEWRVTKFDVSEPAGDGQGDAETADAENGTSEASAGNESGTSKDDLPVTEAEPACTKAAPATLLTN